MPRGHTPEDDIQFLYAITRVVGVPTSNLGWEQVARLLPGTPKVPTTRMRFKRIQERWAKRGLISLTERGLPRSRRRGRGSVPQSAAIESFRDSFTERSGVYGKPKTLDWDYQGNSDDEEIFMSRIEDKEEAALSGVAEQQNDEQVDLNPESGGDKPRHVQRKTATFVDLGGDQGNDSDGVLNAVSEPISLEKAKSKSRDEPGGAEEEGKLREKQHKRKIATSITVKIQVIYDGDEDSDRV